MPRPRKTAVLIGRVHLNDAEVQKNIDAWSDAFLTQDHHRASFMSAIRVSSELIEAS